MFENKYSKLLTILLIVGIIIIVAVLGGVGFIIVKNGKLKQEAEDAVNRFQNQDNGEMNNTQENIITNEIMPDIPIGDLIGDNNSSNIRMYKGFPWVGTIEIPAINLSYPILQDASAKAMDVAVGIYEGPGLNQIGNTTIAGHNYHDGRFFANNKKLVEGDKIYITDESGRKVTYIIYKTYTTTPEDSSYLERDTEGRREISLTTCTDDTKSRLIIWAKEQ